MSSKIDSSEKLAWTPRENVYALCCRFLACAAVLAASGETFTGSNVAKVSFGLTTWAERAAVFATLSTGCRQFAGIAVVAEFTELLAACEACRQMLAEFAPLIPVCTARGGDVCKISILIEFPSPFAPT